MIDANNERHMCMEKSVENLKIICFHNPDFKLGFIENGLSFFFNGTVYDVSKSSLERNCLSQQMGIKALEGEL